MYIHFRNSRKGKLTSGVGKSLCPPLNKSLMCADAWTRGRYIYCTWTWSEDLKFSRSSGMLTWILKSAAISKSYQHNIITQLTAFEIKGDFS